VFAKKIGIDLGTAAMRVYVRGEGIVIDEPALAAVEARSGNLLAAGREARELAAHAPRRVRLVRPLTGGAIADPDVATRLLRHLILRAQGRQRLFRPEVMMCVASAASGRDRRVLTEAAISAGARQAWLIETPVAAALGLGLPVAEAGPQGICDLGAGSVQAAVISRSGVVAVAAEPGGGHALDETIAQMVLERHGVRLDETAAEALKLALGSALPQDASLAAEVSGVAGAGGGAAAPSVTAAELTGAMTPWLRSTASLVRGVVEQTPAELAFEVGRRGFHLTGGGALLRGIDRYLAEETGIPCRVGNDPLTCAVLGTKRALGEFEVVQRRQLYLR